MKPTRRRRPRVKLNRDAVWELLGRLGRSQKELARQCGLSSGYLSQLMNGKRSPAASADRLPLLLKAARPLEHRRGDGLRPSKPPALVIG